MTRLALITVSIFVSAACGTSHTAPDAAILFDAVVPEPTCGNGRLDPREMCDDGNTTSGDGCTEECRREAYCGDSNIDSGEECDDGNNRSGDGCRSDCASDETCGNGIVDYAAGEICDGEPGCEMSPPAEGLPDLRCKSLLGCGDGAIVIPEVCDDMNVLSWDGCSAVCQEEPAMVVSSMSIAGRGIGCDLTGDGTIDNAFQRALGVGTPLLSMYVSGAIMDGSIILLLGLQGLDDPRGENDEDFRIAWLIGNDPDGIATDNFSGTEAFTVSPDSIVDGVATTSVQSEVMSSMLRAGPEDIPLPFGFFDVALRQGRIEGRTVADLDGLYQIQEGLLCGGLPVNVLSLAGSFAGDFLTLPPACDGGAAATLVDLILGGGTAIVNTGSGELMIPFRATLPDLDLDGDGLESYEIRRDGPDGCQPVVVACTDGDGTRIDGRGCYANQSMGDGFSAAFEFTAVRAVLQPVPVVAP